MLRPVLRSVLLLGLMSLALPSPAATTKHPQKHKKPSAHAGVKASSKTAKNKKRAKAKRHLTPAQRAKAARIQRAFVASSQLRPMTQQLMEMRSPQAYSAVEAYARTHHGESSGTMAWLAVGYAHLMDHQYDAAVPALQSARLRAGDLGDYADLFLAQALNGSGQAMAAAASLANFEEKYPDSILKRDAALVRSDALVAGGEAATALKVLEPYRSMNRADVELAVGKAYAALGDQNKAVQTLTHVYADYPTSSQANDALGQIRNLMAGDPLANVPLQQRMARVDLLIKARHYSDAVDELRAILNVPQVSSPEYKREVVVKLAGALYKSGRKSEGLNLLDQVNEQPIDEAGAERLYLKAEEARSKDDVETNRRYVDQLVSSNAGSMWTQEALLSASNMYLLRRDWPNAAKYYLTLAQVAEKGRYAGYAHWKGTWITFHALNDRANARRLFAEQIEKWPAGQEIPAALYWSGRLALEEGRTSDAKAYFAKLEERYRQYYYGFAAVPQLQTVAQVAASHPSELDKVGAAPEPPELIDAPDDDPRVAKARLLTNAALNDYALREMKAAESAGNGQEGVGGQRQADWVPGELARMYSNPQRPDKALRALKQALPGYFSFNLSDVPRFYWETLFPRPWWGDLRAGASVEGLDPYLVASLIRQESEFNPGAVSGANAYGLMQLLPQVAKSMAHDLRVKHWSQTQITNPQMNLRLGTHYFRKLVEKYNGQVEYALAAYNAGEDRVKDWQSNGNYRDIYEFVESIPFTETREYVQAIMRNAAIYSQLYKQDGAATVNTAGAQVKKASVAR
jgi:soluble lytic murein transglycosylase